MRSWPGLESRRPRDEYPESQQQSVRHQKQEARFFGRKDEVEKKQPEAGWESGIQEDGRQRMPGGRVRP